MPETELNREEELDKKEENTAGKKNKTERKG
jgi:hypothetical protein